MRARCERGDGRRENTLDEFRDFLVEAVKATGAGIDDIEENEPGVLDPWRALEAVDELLEKERQVGRRHFVRYPDSDG
jgi:hypothetical protein